MDDIIRIAAVSSIIVIALIVIGFVMARLYCRASKEKAFVRTGMGGQRVIVNGGCMVYPVLHETIPVNMNTLRLEVKRDRSQALITRDRMRVDVLAEFYVRVKPDEDSIAAAAQTLGRRTTDPHALRELVEGKFVDALRAVAAKMTMEELHEQREDFVQKVQNAVSEDLLKNGLELESVSLTGLDQTDREFFNPDNAFDAEGLTRLTNEIEDRRRRRNEIERDNQVAIETKNLESERQTLEIGREREYAILDQQREVEVRRAEQMAGIAAETATNERASEQARIEANRQTEQARINAEREIESSHIEKDREVKQHEIERSKALALANADREIAVAEKDREVKQHEIERSKALALASADREIAVAEKDREVKQHEIERNKALALANADREIAVAEKSKLESVAGAEADRARAEAAREAERVTTAREVEEAERHRQVALTEATKDAEQKAIRIKVGAEAAKAAAVDEAEAIRTLAQAGAAKVTIEAEGEAQADKLRADAAKIRYQIDADGQRALNEADNALSQEIIAMRVKKTVVQALPEIIRESVRPMESIEGIRIMHVEGLGGAPAPGEEARPGNLADQIVASALRYRGQAPLVDAVMREIGLDGADLAGLAGARHADE